MSDYKMILGGLRRVEHDIRPPMRTAITIPGSIDGRSFIVYVCIGGFQPEPAANDADLKYLATDIVAGLEKL